MFATFQRLRALVPECASLSDTELSQVAAQTSPEMLNAKQKILAFVFQSAGVDSIKRMLESRKLEKRQELKASLREDEREMREASFRSVFAQFVQRELESLSFSQPHPSSKATVLTSKPMFVEAIAFILGLIEDRVRSKINAAQQNAVKEASSVLAVARKSGAGSAIKQSKLVLDESDSRFLEQQRAALAAECERLKRELEAVKSEHTRLQSSHAELKEIYDRAVQEVAFVANTPNADPDVALRQLNRRRIMLLKSQNVQLMRQVEIYRTELESREGFVYDVSGNARLISEKLKQAVTALDGKDATSYGNTRATFAECFKMLDAMHKHATRHTRNRLDKAEDLRSQSFRFVSEFIMAEEKAMAYAAELEFHRGVYKEYNTMVADIANKLDHRRKHLADLLSRSVEPLVQLQQRLDSLELTREAVGEYLEEFETALANLLDRIREIEAMPTSPSRNVLDDV
ncbi:hypothetical protein HK105_200731 [Polyrhizophydium stewartii]|uniref:Uncharacterized protein n=1 Tax=Polyrhizophydium stewartii TaxID=2732419 RepID=A0ABR4NK23_9FUNG